jgi:drug/metabolite transporter (DMT)-like permease
VSSQKQQFIEAMLGALAGTAGGALWAYASMVTNVGSAGLFLALSYLWLILIFPALAWVAHRAKKHITRNVIAILGCILFLLDTTCWVGLKAGWIRIGG